jgi:DNA-binding NtrC family response regulator
MLKVHALLARVAAGRANVVLVGEVGVGKGLLAERLHEVSPRAAGPCIQLAASVLDGIAADRARALVEAAAGGTLVLEEPRSVPLAAQVRLAEAIAAAKGDIRLVTLATSEFEDDVRAGVLAPELATRLAGTSIEVPPLRERTEEIADLARDLVTRACRIAGRTPVPLLSPAALDALVRWPWPGNVRELATTMFRAAVAAKTDTIELTDLPRDKVESADAPIDLRAAVNEVERERIELALARCEGNQSRAAKLLGVARNTLIARMRTYGIAPKRPRG